MVFERLSLSAARESSMILITFPIVGTGLSGLETMALPDFQASFDFYHRNPFSSFEINIFASEYDFASGSKLIDL